MSEQTKTVLKGYFETGDTPSQAQFEDLIDTLSTESDVAQLDASVVRIDGLVSTNSSGVSTNVDEIAQLDASVVRIDGYFAGGYTGTFLIADGSTVAVTNGLITGITP